MKQTLSPFAQMETNFWVSRHRMWSRNVLNFPNNDFLASSASSSRWHSNWLCVDVLFISPAGKKGAGSKLKWLLWSINLHEKIIKGVGVGAPGTKWKLSSSGIEMIHCVVCNAWCSVWTGAKSIQNFRMDDSFQLTRSRMSMTMGRRTALCCCNDQSSHCSAQHWLCAFSKCAAKKFSQAWEKVSCLSDVMRNAQRAVCARVKQETLEI